MELKLLWDYDPNCKVDGFNLYIRTMFGEYPDVPNYEIEPNARSFLLPKQRQRNLWFILTAKGNDKESDPSNEATNFPIPPQIIGIEKEYTIRFKEKY